MEPPNPRGPASEVEERRRVRITVDPADPDAVLVVESPVEAPGSLPVIPTERALSYWMYPWRPQATGRLGEEPDGGAER